MKKLALVLPIAIAFSTPAIAGGFHVEVHGGYGDVSIPGNNFDGNGAVYGGGAGYDFDLGEKFFAGVEINAEDNSGRDCSPRIPSTAGAQCLSIGRDFSGVVRVGANLSEKDRLYVIGGYTNQRVTTTTRLGSGTIKTSGNNDGIRVGAGYERTLFGSFYGKLEYRYSNYSGGVAGSRAKSGNQGLVGFGLKF